MHSSETSGCNCHYSGQANLNHPYHKSYMPNMEKNSPLIFYQAWLSRHPKGIRNRGLPPSTCSKSKSSSTGYSYRHGRKTTEDLKVLRFYCYHLQKIHFTGGSSSWTILVKFRREKLSSASKILC